MVAPAPRVRVTSFLLVYSRLAQKRESNERSINRRNRIVNTGRESHTWERRARARLEELDWSSQILCQEDHSEIRLLCEAARAIARLARRDTTTKPSARHSRLPAPRRRVHFHAHFNARALNAALKITGCLPEKRGCPS